MKYVVVLAFISLAILISKRDYLSVIANKNEIMSIDEFGLKVENVDLEKSEKKIDSRAFELSNKNTENTNKKKSTSLNKNDNSNSVENTRMTKKLAQEKVIEEMDTVHESASSINERINEMELSMLAQEADPFWESKAKDEILNTVSKSNFKQTKIDNVKCSGKICRFDLKTSNPSEIDNLFDGETSIVPWSHSGSSFELIDFGSDMETRVVYFLTSET